MNNLPENDEHLEGKDGKDMPSKRAKKKLEIKNLTESKESKTIQDEDSLENDKNDYDNFEDEEDDYDYDNYDYDEDDLGEYYYADITLQPGFSFDHLYNYKEGKCGCSKCITLAESYLNLSPLEAIVNNKTFLAFAGPLISLYQKSKKCADKSTETDEVSLVSDGNAQTKIPTQKALLDDSSNPNKLVIVKEQVRGGKFVFKAVHQGSLNTPNNNNNTVSIGKQPMIKLVSDTPFFKLSSSSFTPTTTWTDEGIKAKCKTEAQIQEAKMLAQQAKKAREKERFEEQMERIRKATLEIKAAIQEKNLAEKSSDGELEEAGPSTSTNTQPNNNKRLKLNKQASLKKVKHIKTSNEAAEKDLYEEDKYYELCYTVGRGKSPLIITLYLECPQPDCQRLFSARNKDGCALNVSNAIAQHLKLVHNIPHPAQCLVCLEHFSKYHLKYHVKSVHRNVQEWPCHWCPEGTTFFDTHEKLLAHYNKRHVRGRFMCAKEGCKFLSQVRADVYRHQSAEHHEQQCDVCGLTFQYRSTLKHHEMLHSDKQSFFCRYEDCAFSASSKAGVVQHVRVRHFGLPLRPDKNSKPERKAIKYVWFLNEEEQLIPCSEEPRKASFSNGNIRTVRKKVIVMKRKEGVPGTLKNLGDSGNASTLMELGNPEDPSTSKDFDDSGDVTTFKGLGDFGNSPSTLSTYVENSLENLNDSSKANKNTFDNSDSAMDFLNDPEDPTLFDSPFVTVLSQFQQKT